MSLGAEEEVLVIKPENTVRKNLESFKNECIFREDANETLLGTIGMNKWFALLPLLATTKWLTF